MWQVGNTARKYEKVRRGVNLTIRAEMMVIIIAII
jgi:hypothetical protein